MLHDLSVIKNILVDDEINQAEGQKDSLTAKSEDRFIDYSPLFGPLVRVKDSFTSSCGRTIIIVKRNT